MLLKINIRFCIDLNGMCFEDIFLFINVLGCKNVKLVEGILFIVFYLIKYKLKVLYGREFLRKEFIGYVI